MIVLLVDLVRPLVHAVWEGSRRQRVGDPYVSAGLRRTGPVKHEGATERFGSELRALRHVEVSPELVSDIETELRWGLIWHEFERTMQAEVDRIFAPGLALVECVDFDDLRELIGLRELAMA